MSDTGPVTAPVGAPAEPSGAPAPADPTGAAPAAPEGQQPLTPEQYQALVDKLRTENETGRKKWGPIADRFSRYHPGDVEQFEQFLDAWDKGDSDAVARWMATNGKFIAGDKWSEIAGLQQQAAAVDGPLNQQQIDLLDPEQLKKYIAEQTRGQFDEFRQQTEQDRLVEQHYNAVLGELKDAKIDIQSPEGAYVLHFARGAGGDIAEGIRRYREWMDSKVKEYASGKAGDAAGAVGTAPSGMQPGPNGKDPLDDLPLNQQGKAKAMRRLQAMSETPSAP